MNTAPFCLRRRNKLLRDSSLSGYVFGMATTTTRGLSSSGISDFLDLMFMDRWPSSGQLFRTI